jgi:thiamine-phosphate pyrophosphorylase
MGNQVFFQPFMQPALHRILDANLDRAREGLRVIEEWCRFGLNDAALTERCKHLRQLLAKLHTTELRSARNTPGDPGTELTHPNEAIREGLDQVLQANFCRVEEALRVLEEYGKIYSADMAASVKQMRYQIYTLETQLLAKHRHQKLKQALLYLVTSPSDHLIPIVESALQGGVTLVQYRDKTADDLVRLGNAQKLRELCTRYNALFIVNDRIDLALAVNADGVHLGQQDLPLEMARQMLGSGRIIGRSTHSPEDLARAIAEGADYVGVGPVYETPTKAGRTAAGLDYVKHAAQQRSVPWFAIGGIDTTNIHEVLEAGATRISVVRGIMQAEQPTLAAQYFLAQLDQKQRLLMTQRAALNGNLIQDPWE